MGTLSLRVVEDSHPLCWDSIHDNTLFAPYLKDALAFYLFYEQHNTRDFFRTLKNWDKEMAPQCATQNTRKRRSHFYIRSSVTFRGKTKQYLNGNTRPTHADPELDRALLLLESGYLLSDAFVLTDATRHPDLTIQTRAKELLQKHQEIPSNAPPPGDK